MIKRRAVSSCSFSYDTQARGNRLHGQERSKLGTGRDFPRAGVCRKSPASSWEMREELMAFQAPRWILRNLRNGCGSGTRRPQRREVLHPLFFCIFGSLMKGHLEVWGPGIRAFCFYSPCLEGNRSCLNEVKPLFSSAAFNM